jgi:tetraacyldisaccharide 4'-kinase
MIKFLRALLFPFAILYGLITFLRNKCFDWKILKSQEFDLPVICVGNLAVGGSGKTPVTEYLVRLLSNYKIAILSRGYGRETQGFLLADQQSTAASIGDEPLQYYQKFPHVTVAVCEDRVTGIRKLEQNHDLIILDDAFQHRKVRAGYQILLFEFEKMMSMQFMLPTGDLREPFSGYKRAQKILITKCPEIINVADQKRIQQHFSDFEPSRIAYSSIRYGDLKPLYESATRQDWTLNSQSTTVFLLSGIANSKPLVNYLKDKFYSVISHEYADHHKFSATDIQRLKTAFEEHPATEKLIVTTEKDAQRLLDASIKDLLLNLPVFFLPIAVKIQEKDETPFNQEILAYVSSTTRNRTIHQAENQ